MKTKQNGNWVIDLENLTCRNIENDLVIVFERKGSALHGKIKVMPMKLVHEWIMSPDCETHIRKALIEADEVFFNEYFAWEIAKKNAETQGTQLIA